MALDYDETEPIIMRAEIDNLTDKLDDIQSKLQNEQETSSAQQTQNGILKDEIKGLLSEVANVKRHAKPIVDFANGTPGANKAALIEAYEFFKSYIKE